MVHLKNGLLSDGIHSFIVIFSQKCIKYIGDTNLFLSILLPRSKIQFFSAFSEVLGEKLQSFLLSPPTCCFLWGEEWFMIAILEKELLYSFSPVPR